MKNTQAYKSKLAAIAEELLDYMDILSPAQLTSLARSAGNDRDQLAELYNTALVLLAVENDTINNHWVDGRLINNNGYWKHIEKIGKRIGIKTEEEQYQALVDACNCQQITRYEQKILSNLPSRYLLFDEDDKNHYLKNED